MKQRLEKISETKRCFFEKINKIDKHLAGLRKREDSNKIIIEEEALQLIQKHKRSCKTTVSTYMPTNWITQKNG